MYLYIYIYIYIADWTVLLPIAARGNYRLNKKKSWSRLPHLLRDSLVHTYTLQWHFIYRHLVGFVIYSLSMVCMIEEMVSTQWRWDEMRKSFETLNNCLDSSPTYCDCLVCLDWKFRKKFLFWKVDSYKKKFGSSSSMMTNCSLGSVNWTLNCSEEQFVLR